jgi:hypothetical protein
MILPQVATLYDASGKIVKWKGNTRMYRRAKVAENVGVIMRGSYLILPASAPVQENDIIRIEGDDAKYRVKSINAQWGKYGLHHYTVEVEAF